MKTRRLRVRLLDVIPEVTRVIDVPAAGTLPELHELLQVCFGWGDSHLHRFVAADASYGVPRSDHAGDQTDEIDEAGVRVTDLPTPFSYHYDFGDGWEHEITLLGPGGDRPGCVAGEGTTQMLDFDLAAVDLRVRQSVGEVPDSVRLVLDLAVDGVRLTPGGRLPRAFVRQVQEHRPDWCRLDRPAAVEDDLQPLAVLHDVLRHGGLLRLSKGVLRPTRAAADDLEVVRRLRSWFVPGEFEGALVEIATGVLVARGPMAIDELADAVFPLLGLGWMRDGRELAVEDVRASLAYLEAEMRGLDLVVTDRALWAPGTSARMLLPGVARWATRNLEGQRS